MKINNLKNYFSLNFLSVLGYISFILIVLFYFVFVPWYSGYCYGRGDDMSPYILPIYVGFIAFFSLLAIFVVLALLTVVEWHLRKKNKIAQREFKSKLHNVLFWIGIFLYSIPFLLFVFYWTTEKIIDISVFLGKFIKSFG